MNRRELMVGAAALGMAGGARAQNNTQAFDQDRPPAIAFSPRQDRLLSFGWRFYEGDIVPPPLVTHDDTYNAAKAGAARGAASPKFDDSAWATVAIPHDFASFQPIDAAQNVDEAYRKRGVAWYRNTLRFEEADHGKHIELQIEGVATQSTVWFNGTLVARILSGYVSTYIDITPYVTYGDALNHLAIRVDATQLEGWWYEGAGIYRDVRVAVRNPVHIVTDGVWANPVQVGLGWKVPVEVTLYNSRTEAVEVKVATSIWDDAQLAGLPPTGGTKVTVPSLGTVVATMLIDFPNPTLWSPDNPHLYQATTRIWNSDAPEMPAFDEVVTTCGFRYTRWDADQGFFLNGQPLKIKGVCLHQDHAGVGTAIPPSLVEYRLKRLKTLGCNAIRCSHNAQSNAFMEACDRLGFLVMAENRNFNPSDDYLRQLEWLVRRDRNHPCVYLWSVFNEEPMQATEQGYEMVRRMSAAVKSLDTTRPVTAAMNGGLDTPINVSQAVDVIGINYQQGIYDAVHKRYPDKPIYSSEDTSAFMTRGEYRTDAARHIMASYDDEAAPWGETHRAAWKAVHERPFIAGQFVWTGFDYHGEPTPHTYPTNSSFFGIFDLCGFDKAAAHIHRAQWIDNAPVLGLVPHWNWQAGDKVRVMACTNADEVELFVNGRSMGRQKGDRLEMNYWTVDYVPGFIEARAYNGGKMVSKVRNETTGEAVALALEWDHTMLGDGRDVVPMTITAVDAKGRLVPTANHKITIETSARIVGLGNGDPNCLEPEKGNTRSLFNGMAQILVAGPAMGENDVALISGAVKADGLKSKLFEMWAQAPKTPTVWQATGQKA